jgi:hypothetical protein
MISWFKYCQMDDDRIDIAAIPYTKKNVKVKNLSLLRIDTLTTSISVGLHKSWPFLGLYLHIPSQAQNEFVHLV